VLQQHSAIVAAIVVSSSKKPDFLAEPARPIVKTAIPSPEGKKAITELDKVFKTRSLIY
jgi:4-aminobutyrate aminotransferase/(S)-3-amino-2-methylpropionate transaminase